LFRSAIRNQGFRDYYPEVGFSSAILQACQVDEKRAFHACGVVESGWPAICQLDLKRRVMSLMTQLMFRQYLGTQPSADISVEVEQYSG